MMDVTNEEIKVGISNKSAKHEALEKVLATGKRLSKMIENIDRIITKEKKEHKKIDEFADSNIIDVNKEVQQMFYISA
jgi:rubrerythrin